MLKKLRASTGTTLIEVLCAIVVLAMSAAFFAVTVSAAGRINVIARESEEKLYTALGVAETQKPSEAYEDSAVSLRVYRLEPGSGGSPDTKTLLFQEEIELYGETDALLSYRKK